LSLNGSLNVNATAQSPFTIDITGLDSLNQIGTVANFNNTQTYSWRLLTAQSGINSFTTEKFQLLSNNFQNILGTGSFWLSQNGNSLYLNFSPVPEPSSVLLVGLAGALAIKLRQRRPKSSFR
jgi:hypothetical protein